VIVEPAAGLKDWVFRAVIETVAVVAQLVVGHVPEVSWLLLSVVDHEVAVSVGVVQFQP
jgi:hypothetical protein